MEENNVTNEMYQKARNELEATTAQLEEKLLEQKAREDSLISLVENLKAELAEKSIMQAHVSELEEKLLLSEKKYAQEVLL